MTVRGGRVKSLFMIINLPFKANHLRFFSSILAKVLRAGVLPAVVIFMMTAIEASAQPPGFASKVETGFVRPVTLADSIELVGSVEAWKAVTLSAKVPGEIVSAPVEEGQAVAAGEVLFIQDRRAEEIELISAQAELDKSLAELSKRNAGSLPEEIEAARRELAAARSAMEATRDEWERLRPLAEQNVISPSEATKAKTLHEVAQAQVLRSMARLTLVEQGFRDEEVLIAEAEVRVRRAQVDEINRRLEDHTIRARASGVIVRKVREAGEWAKEGEEVASMVVLDPLKVRAEVPQRIVGRIRPGQKARMRVDGLSGADDLNGRDFEATIIAVIPQAVSGTRNFPVTFTVPNSDGVLSAGMFARLSLQVGEEREGLIVPRSAVRDLGDRLVVFRVDPLPAGFAVQAPPAGEGGPPGGRGGPPPAPPEAQASMIEVTIVDEFRLDVAIQPRKPGDLGVGSEIVVIGNSRLSDGATLIRLNAPSISGSGGM